MTLTLPALLEPAALAAVFFPFPERHFPLSPLTRRQGGGKRGHQSCPSKMGGRFLLTLALLSVLLSRCQVSARGLGGSNTCGGPCTERVPRGVAGTVAAYCSREKRGGGPGRGGVGPGDARRGWGRVGGAGCSAG